jgi:hypothetical protein
MGKFIKDVIQLLLPMVLVQQGLLMFAGYVSWIQ